MIPSNRDLVTGDVPNADFEEADEDMPGRLELRLLQHDVDLYRHEDVDEPLVPVSQVVDLAFTFLDNIPVGKWPIGEEVSPWVFEMRDEEEARGRVVAFPVSPPAEGAEEHLQDVALQWWRRDRGLDTEPITMPGDDEEVDADALES